MTTKSVVFVLLGAIILTIVGALYIKARRDAYDLSVANSNLRAAAQDSATKYHTKFDSAQTVMGRLQEQAAIREAALGGALADVTKQLGLVTKSVQSLNVKIDKVNTTVVSDPVSPGTPVVTKDSTGKAIARNVTFTLVGPPIEGTLGVVAPFDPTKAGTLSAKLSVTPFDLRVSLNCDKNQDVQFLTEAPSWVTVGIARGTVEPEVCHGPKPSWFGSLGPVKDVGLFATGLGVGYTLYKIVHPK